MLKSLAATIVAKLCNVFDCFAKMLIEEVFYTDWDSHEINIRLEMSITTIFKCYRIPTYVTEKVITCIQDMGHNFCTFFMFHHLNIILIFELYQYLKY